MMMKRRQQSPDIGLRYTLLLSLLLIPFIYSMFFTFALGDDFARANTAWIFFNLPKAFKLMARDYFNWSGRYTHHFIIVFFGRMAVYRITYGIMCMALMALYWWGFFAVFNEVQGRLRRGWSLFLATLCVLVMYCGYPQLNKNYYQLTDILALGAGNAMVLVYIWSLLRIWNAGEMTAGLRRWGLASGILAIGLYEHDAIAVVLLTLCALLLAWRASHRHARTYWLLARVMVVFMLVSFLAPGNFARQEHYSVTATVMADQLLGVWATWLDHSFRVFGTIFIAAVAVLGLCLRPRMAGTPKKPSPALLLAVTAGLFCLLTGGIVMLHGLSDQPLLLGRVGKVVSTMMLLSSYVLAGGACCCLGGLRRVLAPVPRAVFLLPLILWLPWTGNYQKNLAAACSGTTAAFGADMEARKEYLSGQSGAEALVATFLATPFPVTYPFDRVRPEPGTWPNGPAAEFFSVASIRSAPPSPKHAFRALGGELPSAMQEVPSLGRAGIAMDVPGGPNETFVRHWLVLGDVEVPPAGIRTLAVIDGQPWRFMPEFVADWLAGRLEGSEAVREDALLGFSGIVVEHVLNDWRVQGADDTFLIPVATKEWGVLSALYLSVDGTTWHRIPF